MFPAYAGMIPFENRELSMVENVPRIRGDDPISECVDLILTLCSPHTRG